MSRGFLTEQSGSPQWLISGALLAVLFLVAAFLATSRFWLPEEPPVVGVWRASVTYDRGRVEDERFEFRLTGGNVTGHASYLGLRRTIENGRLDGDRLSFHTRSRERVGIEQYELRHEYVGVVTTDRIGFTLEISGGQGGVREPVHFEATRAD
jgi:hypothetical protein